MREKIMPNDVVLHKPSGEKWVVAGVNHEEGRLIPMGYPFPSTVSVGDCELLERHYEARAQEKAVIKHLLHFGLQSYVDVMSAMFHELI